MFVCRRLGVMVLVVCLVGIGFAQPGKRPTRSRVTGATTAAVYIGCSGPSDCDQAIVDRKLACTRTVSCLNHECQFTTANLATCSCFESDVRLCPDGSDRMQFCVETGASTTAWQRAAAGAVCGPDKLPCSTGKAECPTGYQTTKFDGNAWLPVGSCIAEPACPALEASRACRTGLADCPDGVQKFTGDTWGRCEALGCPQRGERRACDTGRPSCPQGLKTWTGSGWTACEGVNCPVECAPGMRPGSSQPCTTTEQCTGRQVCSSNGIWGTCRGPRACPSGWRSEAGNCAWTSPQEHKHASYFPHRASNEAVAATVSIGSSGRAVPVYVEVKLAQWSNPPAGGGGNHCGKGGHVSAWVGCIHPGGARGWGRDVQDREWQDGVMIPLRCEARDVVGIYKHTWGHDAFWHCTRDIELAVVRNHDPFPACR